MAFFTDSYLAATPNEGCMAPEILSTVGLGLDIAGVVLLYKYGLPEDISRTGGTGIRWGGGDPEEPRKAQLYDRRARLALCLLVAGFGLQIASTWL